MAHPIPTVDDHSSSGAASSPLALVFARLILQVPQARSILVVPVRSDIHVEGIAAKLWVVIEQAGYEARLIDVSGMQREEDDMLPGLSMRERLASPTGITVAWGGGLLDDPGSVLASATADAVIVVVRQGKTLRADLSRVREEIARAGGTLAGAIIQT